MNLFRLADRFILRPSTHTLPAKGKTRRLVAFEGGQIEVWSQRTRGVPADDPDCYILKFVGNAWVSE